MKSAQRTTAILEVSLLFYLRLHSAVVGTGYIRHENSTKRGLDYIGKGARAPKAGAIFFLECLFSGVGGFQFLSRTDEDQ